MWSGTANISSSLGILVYNELTSDNFTEGQQINVQAILIKIGLINFSLFKIMFSTVFDPSSVSGYWNLVDCFFGFVAP